MERRGVKTRTLKFGLKDDIHKGALRAPSHPLNCSASGYHFNTCVAE